ncbi:putative polyol transporter 1 [Hibiscus syriacus]|uniref:Polyol transporter 1 n=1 Tax=Hibiscus syriacus TaxID=106335 RepID=A0A6A2Y9H6_HIBSY|nr:putative polyol transporter 1 [Hibiscus syriacus]
MRLTSSQELDKQKDYYHLLDSDPKNVGRHERCLRFNKYVLAAAILASTNSVLLGYDIGVMSGAVLYIKDDLKINSTQQEILVGCLNLCSLIGSLAAGKTSDSIGRRYTIVLAAATFFAGAVLMGLAPSFPLLMAGRLLAGIGVGYSLMIGPLYTAEISPAMTRGFLSSLPEVFINIGILLGYVSNFTLSGLPQPLNWRLMLGLAALPAGAVALGVIVMPESPRWLVMKGQLVEARQVLIKTSDSEVEADARLVEMANAAETWEQEPHLSSSQWKGQGQFGVTIIMGIVKTCFVLVSALFLDHYGRRPLLLLGTTGMAVSLACLGLGSVYLQQCNEKPVWAIALCVVAVCFDFSFFSIGLGPITWVYSSEIFPMRLRAQGSSLAISVNRIITFGGMFLVLSGIMVAGTVFFYLFLPETKGKSLEEIEAIFDDKYPQS